MEIRLRVSNLSNQDLDNLLKETVDQVEGVTYNSSGDRLFPGEIPPGALDFILEVGEDVGKAVLVQLLLKLFARFSEMGAEIEDASTKNN